MSKTANSPAIELIRQSIEDLSLEVALYDFSASEPSAGMAAKLGQIRQLAGEAGMSELASMAASAPESEAAWLEIINRLQQALNEPEPKSATAAPPAPTSLNQDPELVADFILESREHLSTVESQLLALEQDPGNAEAINTIFRGFHTIKGLAGFLEFMTIQRFAHEVETLLDMARNSKIPVDSALIDLILQSTDHMNRCLGVVETGGEQPSGTDSLIARIAQMIAGAGNSTANATPDLLHLATAVGPVSAPAPPEANQPELPAAEVPAASVPAANVPTSNNSAGAREATAGPRSVKVDTSKLDYLVDMVGELVIAQSMIQHDPDIAAMKSQRLLRNLAQLTRITGDVQRVAMAMRMHQVSQLFQRMARLVRDLARKTGKQVNLELSGEDTELDRNLVEELADPLMHMVRNAVDHGVEPPEARTAAGKDPTARVNLRAFHQGGFINIEISDDGRGIRRDKILEKARQRGLLAGAGDHLSDQEVFNFIFEPGFSTADKITDVSGRGVGMDVVRKQISKLRGRIDIRSKPGEGTTFVLKLPLTLAIIEGLVVGVGHERYIVPLFSVKEMFRPQPDALSTVPGGGEMVLVRGALLPILRLHSRFGVEPTSTDPTNGVCIVVENARRKFCVLADELIGKQEVVIKSLGATFKHVTGVAGGSILGDGRVGLILDVEALYGAKSGE